MISRVARYLPSHITPVINASRLLSAQHRRIHFSLPCDFSTRCWSSSTTQARKWSTILAKNLAEAITTTGPIPIATYMRQCLTSPDGGYYTSKESNGQDQFGRSGDFVTSPEISQIFGELVGIWFVAEWMAQGKMDAPIRLIELGPGRGTLMDDMLRTIKNFKPMAAAIKHIHLVEASPTLRDAQHKFLCGSAPMQPHPDGHQSKSKHLPDAQIVWTEDVSFMNQDRSMTPFVIAHEFFDALPIHAFQSVPRSASTSPRRQNDTNGFSEAPNEWRELLVSPCAPTTLYNSPKASDSEFELSLSTKTTPYSQYLPTLSQRYASLLSRVGSTIEISPSARTTMSILARLVGGSTDGKTGQATPAGAALVIDYGPASTIPINTLRGIQQHKPCSPFSAAGAVDLSADVDFGALVETALSSSEGVEVHGPLEQADWLASMGGKIRCDMLVETIRTGGIRGLRANERGKETDELADEILAGWKRLVDRGPNGMGKLYKAIAVVPMNGDGRRPVGFGGDVV